VHPEPGILRVVHKPQFPVPDFRVFLLPNRGRVGGLYGFLPTCLRCMLSGLERARAHGRIGGRPRVVCDRKKVLVLREAGKSLGQISAELRLSKTTVSRLVTMAGN
jgi:hypothetical protein